MLATPICSGIPGIGKTRMLHEWSRFIPENTDTLCCTGVIVPYFNGHRLTGLDEHLTIEASFSWRLLYAYAICAELFIYKKGFI
jgi:hypothetical protein